MWDGFKAKLQQGATGTVVVIGMGDTGVLTAAHLPRGCRVIGVATKPLLVSGQELGQRLTDNEVWRQNYLIPLRAFRRLKRAELLHGRATHVDPLERTVVVELADGDTRTLQWDALVVATGVSNGFWRDASVEDTDTTARRLQTQVQRVRAATSIAVVGGGPSGTSLACNIKRQFPRKSVAWFYSGELPLPGYHPQTRAHHGDLARDLGVEVYPRHRAMAPGDECLSMASNAKVVFEGAQADYSADLILWATGRLRPHTDFLPDNMLTAEGFVATDRHLRVQGYTDVYAIGDVAATDPLRCSARNWAYQILCRNIATQLKGQVPTACFEPPGYRWGSILGVQPDGLVIHQAGGQRHRLPRWFVRLLLYPVIVHRWIYGGIRRNG